MTSGTGLKPPPLPKGTDEAFCSSCGILVKLSAEIWPNCGVRLRKGAEKTALALLALSSKLSLYPGEEGPEKIYKGPDESTQNRYAGGLTENDQSDENKGTVTLQKVDQFFIPDRQECG